MTDLTSFNKTDLVDDHVAGDVNKLIASVWRSEYANTETISATRVLADIDCQLQFLTASGADRTVKLPPEATTNHFYILYNSGASNNVVVQDDSGTYTFATLAPDEYCICYPLNNESWRVDKYIVETQYKIAPTVASNALTVKVTHLDGTDPSLFRPLAFTIGGVRRYITAATNFTIAAGTSYFNLGAVEFATIEQQLFVYVVWDSNSSIVALSAARIPYGRLVSDFSATTTNEKHLYNYANFTSTDDVINIGNFHVTNSGTASFNWSVPTFTSLNLRHEYQQESDWLTWAPVYTASGSLTYTSVSTTFAKYKHTPNGIRWELRASGTLGGTASTQLLCTVPFEALQSANSPACGFGNTAGVSAVIFVTAATPDKLTFSKYDISNYATSGACVLNAAGFYET